MSMRNNPYTPPPLIDGSGLFIGREAIFDQINELLTKQDEATTRRPFLLNGSPKIGKTALLRQIENGRLGAQYIPIYIDLNTVTLDSVSSFYWDLAHKIRQTLTTQKQIDIAEFNQTTFVAAPLQAFFLQLIKPASNAFTAQSLLLLFDNAHILVEQIQQQQMPADLILDLQNELRQANNATSIFALTSPSDTVPTIAGLPFSQWTHNIQLEPLTEEETHALVRDPVGYTIVKEVSRYIHDLTQGHPASIQKICHALYDYQQENGLAIITVADIVAVQKQLGNHALWETAVSHEQPTFTIQPNPALARTIHTVSHQALWYKQPIFIGLAALTLVSLAFILLPILIRRQNQNTANALANITATPGLIEPVGTNESDINLDTDIEQVSSATPEPPPSLTPTATNTPSPTPTPTPTPTNTPDAYPNLITREQDGMIMVYIPEDTFLMGSAEDDFLSVADEQPQREVHMNAFYIDKFEVNIEQYAAFL
ncbi:MAG: AAA-like domain-containing protein, partial [Anaerolineales bacterium]|nr:AAA-like domain-containing protein [Anaerolineales bacterium]